RSPMGTRDPAAQIRGDSSACTTVLLSSQPAPRVSLPPLSGQIGRLDGLLRLRSRQIQWLPDRSNRPGSTVLTSHKEPWSAEVRPVAGHIPKHENTPLGPLTLCPARAC